MTLNPPDTEFTGGGTQFFEIDQHNQGGTLFRPKDVGSLVLFSGRHLHEGLSIFRYINIFMMSYIFLFMELK